MALLAMVVYSMNGGTMTDTPVQPESTVQTLPELLAAVQLYFDSLYYCDTTMLNTVFHPSSSLFDADEDDIFIESIESFSTDVGGRVSPASKDQDREDEILSIDFLSAVSATVKIRLRAHQNVFVDHLGFVKTADGWRIVSKIWHLEKEITA